MIQKFHEKDRRNNLASYYGDEIYQAKSKEHGKVERRVSSTPKGY